MNKTILVACDHAGIHYKNIVKKELANRKVNVLDFGNYVYDELDDYPDYLHKAAYELSQDIDNKLAIVFGGSGVGESVLMNRYENVRCLPIFINDVDLLFASAHHDNINSLAVGARFVEEESLPYILERFLNIKYINGEKYLRRISKIEHVKE